MKAATNEQVISCCCIQLLHADRSGDTRMCVSVPKVTRSQKSFQCQHVHTHTHRCTSAFIYLALVAQHVVAVIALISVVVGVLVDFVCGFAQALSLSPFRSLSVHQNRF